MANTNQGRNRPKTRNASDENITLSAAILSPINSLFEAQIHAARAFLSFVLQLGFKDKPNDDQLGEFINSLEKKKEQNGSLSFMEEQSLQSGKKRRLEQLQNKVDNNKELSDKENSEFGALTYQKEQFEGVDTDEDVFNLEFKYANSNGDLNKITVPAVALVPVKPLAITSAEIEFYMNVKSSNETFRQKQSSRFNSDKPSPWAFVDPKRIKGKIESSEKMQNDRGIKVSIKIEATPMPEGLSNLLTSLTQSARVEEDQKKS